MCLNNDFEKLLQRILVTPEYGLLDFRNQYKNIIYKTALSICKDEALAQEVEDDVLIKFWRNASRLKKIKNPSGFIYKVTVNCAKSALRGKKYVQLDETMQDYNDGIQDFIESESFYFAIKILPELESIIIVYKVSLNFTFEEIAKMLNKSPSTISTKYYRSLDKLKEYFEKNVENA